jgi:predicted AAA+ superfamily ATPase
MILNRIPMSHLAKWIKHPRRKPLVLRGARQVGKSTLIEAFSKEAGYRLVTVNCEKNRHLDRVFESLDLSRILPELESVAAQGPVRDGVLLFLDEIQAVPHALQALRYFYEERPDIPVVAAGSLLEFAMSKHSFSMPVGRIQYLYMGPMTFREFADAFEPDLAGYLDSISFDGELPETAHLRLCSLYRRYLYVGGMPEAVAVFKETGSISDVGGIQQGILDTYVDDFAKYGQHQDLALMQRVFSSVPRMLGQKIKYVNLAPGERAARVRTIIHLLAKAQVIMPVYHTHSSGIPLGASIDESVFKLAFLDVGIANRLCGLNWSNISNAEETRLVNGGGIAEQFAGQHLAFLGQGKPELTYWQREGRQGNAEVDYVVSAGPHIFPVEVKAGKSGTLKSLDQFVLRKMVTRALRFDLNPPSRQTIMRDARAESGVQPVKYELLSLPLYAIGELPRLLMDEMNRSGGNQFQTIDS